MKNVLSRRRYVTQGILTGLACFMGSCTEKVAVPSPVEFEQTAKIENVSEDLQKAKFYPESFTTKGKPTRTVKTPWGEREVYDFNKDPDVIAYHEEFFENNLVVTKNIIELNNQVILPAYRTSLLDFYRIGCIRIVDSYCTYKTGYLVPVCDISQTLGSSKLSECEKKNSTFFGHGLAGTATLRGDKPCEPVPLKSTLASAEEFISKSENLVCDLWIGEETDNYWNTLLIYGPIRTPTDPKQE